MLMWVKASCLLIYVSMHCSISYTCFSFVLLLQSVSRVEASKVYFSDPQLERASLLIRLSLLTASFWHFRHGFWDLTDNLVGQSSVWGFLLFWFFLLCQEKNFTFCLAILWLQWRFSSRLSYMCWFWTSRSCNSFPSFQGLPGGIFY